MKSKQFIQAGNIYIEMKDIYSKGDPTIGIRLVFFYGEIIEQIFFTYNDPVWEVEKFKSPFIEVLTENWKVVNVLGANPFGITNCPMFSIVVKFKDMKDEIIEFELKPFRKINWEFESKDINCLSKTSSDYDIRCQYEIEEKEVWKYNKKSKRFIRI